VNSLPLAGYETNCDAVAKKLKIQGLRAHAKITSQ
jgi:hypothetical protein